MSLRENKEKVRGIRKSDVIACAAAFFVAFLAVIVILCAGGIVPFGPHSLMDSGAENSVLNLFFQEDGTVIPQAETFTEQELSDVLDALEYESTLWSLRRWAQSGGLSGLYSLFWAVCAGIAAAACFVLLKCRIPGETPVLLAGAAAYGLCSWLPAYLSQPVWVLVMALAPLVLAGACRMCRGKRPVFYVAAAAVLLIGVILFEVLMNPAENILAWSPGGGLKDILSRLFPAQGLRKNEAGINISMGILALVFLPVYFCNCRILQKERAFCGGVLALAVFLLDCTGLRHGAFLFCLLVVLIGCQGLVKWEGVSVFHAILAAGNAAMLILIAKSEASEAVPLWFYAAAAAALVLLLSESRELSSWMEHITAGKSRIKAGKPITFPHSRRFLTSLLLSFLILADSVGNLACVCIAEAGEAVYSAQETSGSGETGNPMMLPAAFPVSADAENWTITDSAKPVQSQNELLKLISGTSADVYERLGASLFSYGNCVLQEGDGWEKTLFQTSDTSGKVYFHYTWNCTADGAYYLESNFRSGSIAVESGNGMTEMTVSDDSASWLCLGELEEGSSVEVEVIIEGEQSGCCGMDLYYFHSEEWEEIWGQLSAEAFCVNSVGQDEICGAVTLEENERLLLALPLAEEWEISCDGEEADTTALAENLLLVYTEQGTHELTFALRETK